MANRSILESDSRLYLDRRPRQFHPGDPGNVILRNIDKQVHLNRKIRYTVITLDHLDIFPIFLLTKFDYRQQNCYLRSDPVKNLIYQLGLFTIKCLKAKLQHCPS